MHWRVSSLQSKCTIGYQKLHIQSTYTILDVWIGTIGEKGACVSCVLGDCSEVQRSGLVNIVTNLIGRLLALADEELEDLRVITLPSRCQVNKTKRSCLNTKRTVKHQINRL